MSTPRDVLDEVGVSPRTLFDDPDNLIPYPVARSLAVAVSARCHELRSHRTAVGPAQVRLADMGLAGQVPLSAQTPPGRDSRTYPEHYFSLQNTAATVSVISLSRGYTRLVYAIVEHGMTDTGPPAVGSDGTQFQHPARPLRARMAPNRGHSGRRNAPSNLRPCQKFFHRATTLRQRRVRSRVRKPLARPATAAGGPVRRDSGSRLR